MHACCHDPLLLQAKEEAEAEARRQLEAIAADSSKTEEQRQKARKALKAQKVGTWGEGRGGGCSRG